MVLSFYSFLMPAFGVLYDAVLTVCWYYSVNAQSSADLSDSEHISTRPWYLEKACSAVAASDKDACFMGKACFYVALVSL